MERVSIGEQTPRDNNTSDDRRTEQENVRDTGNGRELQGENDTRVVGETANATVRQDTRESEPPNTDTPNGRRNDNQGYNRESGINDIEETQEPNKDLGSFSIEENINQEISSSIEQNEDLEEKINNDIIDYINSYVGKEIDFENNKYLIYRVNEIFNEVSLTRFRRKN